VQNSEPIWLIIFFLKSDSKKRGMNQTPPMFDTMNLLLVGEEKIVQVSSFASKQKNESVN
jgi:hypothetical protein